MEHKKHLSEILLKDISDLTNEFKHIQEREEYTDDDIQAMLAISEKVHIKIQAIKNMNNG